MEKAIINQTLQEILNVVKATKEFTVAQAPDVIRQFITWGIIKNSMVIVGCLIYLGILYWWLTKKFNLLPGIPHL